MSAMLMPRVAEDRADRADHPGHVGVAHDEHVARRRQVDDVVVDADDARRVLLAVERAGDVRGAPLDVRRGARRGSRSRAPTTTSVSRTARPRSSASCGAFTNDTGSSTTGPSTPFSTDEREHAAVVVGDLALVADLERVDDAAGERGEQPAEPLGERQERLHRRARLGRGEVDGERHELAARARARPARRSSGPPCPAPRPSTRRGAA